MESMEMFISIQKLKKMGYKKQQAARELDIDAKTVRKYWDMTEEDYVEYSLAAKQRTKMMDAYHGYVLDKLTEHREITSAIIYDNLLEDFVDFAPTYRTVRLYVANLRETEGLPAPKKIRQYMEVSQLPPGFQAQVDMGQKHMKDSCGRSVKIYIFAMVLSASRYKFVCFQLVPFNAKDFCTAHDKAFKFFGGRPTEIVYDQDRVMVVSENGGDILYTEAFEIYKNYVGFTVHLCRGNDPQSKGKIEAVVKFVKYNFMQCRVFHSIDRLHHDAEKWLDRTGNGKVHETTKIVPKVAFMEEIKHLKPAPELSTRQEVPKVALIRKNNMVLYKQNRYQMPYGTYSPGRHARIEVDSIKNQVSFFDSRTGELLEELPLAEGIGKAVKNTHPDRDRKPKHKDLLNKVLAGFADNSHNPHPQATAFVQNILTLKPRYTRDQLCILAKLQERFSLNELLFAIDYCTERSLFNATDFKDTLEYFASKKDAHTEHLPGVKLPVKYRLVVADTRPLQVYSSLVRAPERSPAVEDRFCEAKLLKAGGSN